jgi:N6-L-threonylcarbamoyladenine synthase
LGSLLVGLVTAKSLALALGIPFVGVHHIEAHMMAPFLNDQEYLAPKNWKWPFLSLVVSGGHTSLFKISEFGKYTLLSETIDDAAGEAFDKFAKMVGLGYPGGVQVDRLAQKGDATKFDFPRAMLKEKDFSFSGLKASAQRMLDAMSAEEIKNNLNDLCASYQEAIVDVLFEKSLRMAREHNISCISVTGGVSANSRLREKFLELQREGFEIAIAPLRFCTDNAAMIAYTGMRYLELGVTSDQKTGVLARATI